MSATTFGLASGVAAGTATIKAASGSIFGAATLTVVEPILVSIAVTPANAIVAKGLTRQFIATGSYTPALTQDITSQVTWSTTNSSIATMSTTTAGLASGVATGSTTITATDPSTSVQGSTTLSVMLLLGGSVQGNTLNLANTVSTFAGSAGVNGHTDGTGTAARFYLPTGIATDGRNLYVTDTSNHTIRKVEIATGAVTTLAGLAPFSGSTNGTGTTARFNSPYGITTDGTNLYVADTYNHIIRKVVIATGEVTTFAGMKGTSGSVDGTGTAAAFYYPYGITTDGTNLYVADTYNHTIRQVVIATSAVTTLAGTAGNYGVLDLTGPAAQFDGPAGITTDGTNLYVADTNNHAIRKVAIATGAVTTLAGLTGPANLGSTDGTGTTARFHLPYGITTDGANLYVADTYNHSIRKVGIATGVVTTPVGAAGTCGSTDGTGAAAQFCHPDGATTDGTNLYVTDEYNHTIRKVQ